MNKKITFKIENENENEIVDFNLTTFNDNPGSNVRCYLNDAYIGDILCHWDSSDTSVYLEYWELDEKYKNQGYGLSILVAFKSLLKDLGFNYITGSCNDKLMGFYKEAGAVFENRKPDDETYINNVFYIDLC